MIEYNSDVVFAYFFMRKYSIVLTKLSKKEDINKKMKQIIQ